MPQVHCYLPQKIVEQLEKIKRDNNHSSLSKAVREMIDLGIQTVLNQPNELSKENLEKKRIEGIRAQQTQYLQKILSLNTDILRCVYDQNKLPESPKLSPKKDKPKGENEQFTEGWVYPALES